MKWKVAHGTARGSSHQRSGLKNQDYAVKAVGPKDKGSSALVAVSDGHGGARHFRSHVGSVLAANTAATLVMEFIQYHSDPARETVPDEATIKELTRRITETWVAAAQSDFNLNPFTEEELAALQSAEDEAAVELLRQNPVLAYGATLLVAAATELFVLYLQLGDGDILAVDGSGQTVHSLPQDERLIANQTTSLCQPEAWQDFRWSILSDPAHFPSLVLISTDGYSNSFRTDADFLQIGHDYLEIIRDQGLEALEEDLPGILAEASQHGSGDDVTLGLLQGDISTGAAASATSATESAAATATAEAKPAKLPRAGGSKSALYEQLKQHHSAQRRELERIAAKNKAATKDIRRLKLLLIVAVALALGFAAERYWKAHESPPIVDKEKPRPTRKPDTSENKPPAPDPSPQFVLQLDSGNSILLDNSKNRKVSWIDIGAGDSEKLYAEVAQDNDSDGKPILVLINRSGDRWQVKPASQNSPNGVKLRDGVRIVFRKSEEGGEIKGEIRSGSQPADNT